MVPSGPSNRPTFVNILHCLSQWTGQPYSCLPGGAALSGRVCNSKLSCNKKLWPRFASTSSSWAESRTYHKTETFPIQDQGVFILFQRLKEFKHMDKKLFHTSWIPVPQVSLRMFHLLIQLNPGKSQIPALEWCPHGSGHATTWTVLSSTWCNSWGVLLDLGQELDLTVLMGPLQLSTFYDSTLLSSNHFVWCITVYTFDFHAEMKKFHFQYYTYYHHLKRLCIQSSSYTLPPGTDKGIKWNTVCTGYYRN